MGFAFKNADLHGQASWSWREGVSIHRGGKQSAEERNQIRINEWVNSDWSEEIAEQEARAQAERDAEEKDRRGGFWCD
jgi:hypothetical protein